ncbi:hypothetical protein [Actinacidiphila oryziradicis]|uniref:Uncharacterized protein n=1 Tax=Actinacidiphila oryziradicis TaxID=2571141 RepID=A0A4U0RWD5_9ACTN|nr:hypothetical protein [Actinacidiphila oryziradicis]TKA00604.1 hypothetical protein FCI23_42560 [Actinacidiphila oryziradicis]
MWAAYQVERWRDRLDKERGNPPRQKDKALQLARNALEHLDEAALVDDRAVAPPKEDGAKSDRFWSLRKLEGIDIGITDDTTFCGIERSDLHLRALEVVRTIENDLAEELLDQYAELLRGS